MISFTVPAVPVPQPRARATTVNGHARMYQAGSKHAIHAFKASVRLAFSQVYAGPPLVGVLCMHMVFVLPRPKNLLWKRRPMPRAPHIKSNCDIDNACKAVMDALNGLLYVDDGQVAELHTKKCVASSDEQPHVEIKIFAMDDHGGILPGAFNRA